MAAESTAGLVMSDHEHETQVEPARSKVKLTRNAKGQAQWEISAVEGTTQHELDRLRVLAVQQWRHLERDLAGQAA